MSTFASPSVKARRITTDPRLSALKLLVGRLRDFPGALEAHRDAVTGFREETVDGFPGVLVTLNICPGSDRAQAVLDATRTRSHGIPVAVERSHEYVERLSKSWSERVTDPLLQQSVDQVSAEMVDGKLGLVVSLHSGLMLTSAQESALWAQLQDGGLPVLPVRVDSLFTLRSTARPSGLSQQ